MTTNHIFLVMGYIDELKSLAMVQNWIDGAREAAPMNQEMQLSLDRRQQEITLRKVQIHDEMFEIARSN